MKLDYLLLDVFTKEQLQGNPLAVVRKADGLLDDQMQAIASEFNLSETVFICRPNSERHNAAIRIFTPRTELPFAGHPTVGAAVALALDVRVSAVRIETKIGVITCLVERVDRRSGQARFSLPHLPVVAGDAPSTPKLAGALGLDLEEIGCGDFVPSVYSAGVIYYLVPVRDADSLKRARPERRGWGEIFPLGAGAVYLYTATPSERGNQFAARMFEPGLAQGEDPATGGAAAALIAELAKRAGEGQTEYVIRQGLEMGRLSRISVQIRKQDGQLTHGGIGGDAVVVGTGSLDLAY